MAMVGRLLLAPRAQLPRSLIFLPSQRIGDFRSPIYTGHNMEDNNDDITTSSSSGGGGGGGACSGSGQKRQVSIAGRGRSLMKPPTTCLLLHAALDQYKRADPLHTHFTNAALYSYTCFARRSRQRQLFPVTATTPNAAPHPPHPRVSTRPGRERPGRRHHCPAAAAATTTTSSSSTTTTTTTTTTRAAAAAAAVLVLAKHWELASEGLCRRAREATRPAAATGFKTNAASEKQDGQPDKESSRRKRRRWRRRWWRDVT